MAKTLWGNVYFKDVYAGRLEEKPGGRYVFTYDASYLDDKKPAIAHTLPLHPKPYISESGLHPFFDNLVAEGWLCNAQARALGIAPSDRFALMLGFGHDLAGAVSVVDPDPQAHHKPDHTDEATLAALMAKASLSGIQRKLLVVKDGKQFRPTVGNELSTHIAKLPSGNLNSLLELEYLTTIAIRTLLPNDKVVDMELMHLSSINEDALIIPRFDRTPAGKRLHHFEEFNQLLGHSSGEKYNGGYEEMGQFILNSPNCIPAEADILLKRILACLMVGNTDAHFKNFAMFHTADGLRLTPSYDLVASSFYREYPFIALQVCGIKDLSIGKLEAKHLLEMGKGFNMSGDEILEMIDLFNKRLPKAQSAIEKSRIGSRELKNQLQKQMEKRWNGCFKLIGPLLSKRQSKGEKD